MSKVSELIKTIRKEHDLSQQDLAEIMTGRKDATLQFISLIENGHSKLPISAVRKICKHLGIDPWIFVEALSEDYKAKVLESIREGRKYDYK